MATTWVAMATTFDLGVHGDPKTQGQTVEVGWDHSCEGRGAGGRSSG